MHELRGRVTVVLTPNLRDLALAHVYETEQGDELDKLVELFQVQEAPDGYVIDAAASEAEARMIVVIARAVLWRYQPETLGVPELHTNVWNGRN